MHSLDLKPRSTIKPSGALLRDVSNSTYSHSHIRTRCTQLTSQPRYGTGNKIGEQNARTNTKRTHTRNSD